MLVQASNRFALAVVADSQTVRISRCAWRTRGRAVGRTLDEPATTMVRMN